VVTFDLFCGGQLDPIELYWILSGGNYSGKTRREKGQSLTGMAHQITGSETMKGFCRVVARPRKLGFTHLAIVVLGFLNLPGTIGAMEPTRLTIAEAVAEALQNNPSGRIARLRVAQAEAMVQQARSFALPLLRVEAAYQITDQPMMAFGSILNQQSFTPQIDFNRPGTTDNLRLKAELRHRLFDFGGTAGRTQEARHTAEAAEWERTAVDAEIAFAVVRTAWQMRQMEETIRAQEANVGAIESALEVAQAKFAAGTFLKTEVLNLEVQLAEAKENHLHALNSFNLARKALENLLGREPERPEIHLIFPTGDPQDLAALSTEGVSTTAQRGEIRALEAALAAADAALETTRAKGLPAVDAFGGVQMDHGWETGGTGEHWMVGLSVTWDFFDGGRNAASRSAAMARREEVREHLRQQMLAIRLEVEQARLNLNRARQTLEVTQRMVEQAREAAQLSRARFEKGVILSSELIDVETRLTSARMRRAVAVASLYTHLAELRRALGQPVVHP
jgi:outer membrane protein